MKLRSEGVNIQVTCPSSGAVVSLLETTNFEKVKSPSEKFDKL
jgi:hypothetical protein